MSTYIATGTGTRSPLHKMCWRRKRKRATRSNGTESSPVDPFSYTGLQGVVDRFRIPTVYVRYTVQGCTVGTGS